MCGKEVSGFAAATPNLYQDKTFILCRSRTTTKRAVRIAEEMAGASGARVMWLEPDLHDSFVAWVSHLPYFVAATLMKRVSTAAAWNDTLWQVSGTGFRDTSRLSGSDAAMMADIVATNRAEIMISLRQYQSEMSALLEILARGEEGEIREWLIACEREHWRYRRRPGV
jgi:prephenate dehydrogenase